MAVASPSTRGLVATITSSMPRGGARPPPPPPGMGGHDPFLHAAGADPGDQLGNLQLVGADAVERRDGAVQDMILAAKLTGALERDDVAGVLDDAKDAVASRRVRAGRTRVDVGDRETDRAIAHLVFHVQDGLGQRAGLFRGGPEGGESK